jgi:hypothetical protein
MDDFIGRGENEIKKIFQVLFPKATISAQVQIGALIKSEDYETLDQEIKNHKFDLVVHIPPNILVIEVNYKHKEKAAKKWRTIFTKLLIDARKIPVTIDDYNSEYLFSDSKRLKQKKPWGSYIDVIRELERQGITPNGTLL